MSEIILPGRPGWFGMVSPREEEMPDFLKVIAQGWRTPKRKWEDLWRLRRGELNHVLGMRQHSGPKYQRGAIGATGRRRALNVAGGGTMPNLQDITNYTSQAAPTDSRQQYAYDSDGGVDQDVDATTLASIVYAPLTTQTDDANDHTNDWWPDQPDVNEGLNWDIMYSNEVLSLISGSGVGIAHLFKTGGTNRTTATWYLLDTVSNDHASASNNGCIGLSRANGGGKSPATGFHTLTVDVDIRATGSGSSVASMAFDLDVEGT